MPKLVTIIAVTTILNASAAYAIERCVPGGSYTCVVDGRTVRLKGETFRFEGYDVPREEHGCGGRNGATLAQRAADRLAQVLSGGGLFMHRVGEDRAGRTLAKLYVSGRDVSDMMVAEGLARKLPDGRKFWCE